jgi:hypothetical protein
VGPLCKDVDDDEEEEEAGCCDRLDDIEFEVDGIGLSRECDDVEAIGCCCCCLFCVKILVNSPKPSDDC